MKHHRALLASLLLAGPLSAQGGPVQPRDSGFGSDTVPVVTPELESYITTLMERWHVPGLAIAIVDGDKTWTKGYGVSSLTDNTPVTPETLFRGGSTTKSMTAAAMAVLIDEAASNSNLSARLTWDTPLRDVMGDEFELADPWATSHITITDALTHRTGVGSATLANTASVEESVRRLRHVPLVAEPRTRYLYNNLMYITVGRAVEVLSATPLAKFLRERVWEPMGMTSTFLLEEDALAAGTLSDEFFFNNDTDAYVKVSTLIADGAAGAGAVISNVLDYARYLRAALTGAGPVSPASHAALRGPQMLVDAVSGPGGNLSFNLGATYYGFGWRGQIIEAAEGAEETWSHSGAIGQFRADMWAVPRRNFGVAVLLNAPGDSPGPVANLITYRVIFDLLGTPPSGRINLDETAELLKYQTDATLKTCPDQVTALIPPGQPSLPRTLPLSAYTGSYFAEVSGFVNVSRVCNGGNTSTGAPGSPAHPTVDDDGCVLRVDWAQTPGRTEGVELEHVHAGALWVAWIYLADVPDFRRPFHCIPVRADIDEASGVVTGFSMGLVAGAPLMAFTKVE